MDIDKVYVSNTTSFVSYGESELVDYFMTKRTILMDLSVDVHRCGMLWDWMMELLGNWNFNFLFEVGNVDGESNEAITLVWRGRAA